MSKSVVLFGRGSLSCRIAQAFKQDPKFELAGIVCPSEVPYWQESLHDFAVNLGVTPWAWRDFTRQTERFDLGFSCYHEELFRPEQISRFDRLLNLHNSPLPKYQGVMPINWALHNEESHHGVTVHEINEGIDSGPILGQILFAIQPAEDEVIDVYKRCLALGWDLFNSLRPFLLSAYGFPQERAKATYFKKSQADSCSRRGWARNFTGSQREFFEMTAGQKL